MTSVTFPLDPLAPTYTDSWAHRRRLVVGVLESYNSNYDAFAEASQNALDALEDAFFAELDEPYVIKIFVDLVNNELAILDTGIGMTLDELVAAVAPSVSFKTDEAILTRRGRKHAYRGYKGVGMTYLAYGTNDFALHTKRDEQITKTRLRYGRAWAYGQQEEPPKLSEDESASPLDNYSRGTYVRLQFSSETQPRSLAHIASNPSVWPIIFRTRTAIGQVLLDSAPLIDISVELQVTDSDNQVTSARVKPEFIWPHEVEHDPPFQMLSLDAYYRNNPQTPEPDTSARRQDGIYCHWDKERIKQELTQDQRTRFADDLERYDPSMYAFLPYQGSMWSNLNEALTGSRARNHLKPGLIVAVTRQRMADVADVNATRYETLSRNIQVVTHFHNARPDQGRKTLQEQVMELAQAMADRAVQYLARQRAFLRPAGESPTPGQRRIERDHSEWIFNVKRHREDSPLHIPPITIISEPLTEQDVVGLFHQLTAYGAFPGIEIFATSQVSTYDCLARFRCSSDAPGLRYRSDGNPLGLAPFILGESEEFETREVTIEFKNNLDGLIQDLDSDSPKSFEHIDVVVCWSSVGDSFPGYHLEEIAESNREERKYPGVTHLLRKDGSAHVEQVVLLRKVTQFIEQGYMSLAR